MNFGSTLFVRVTLRACQKARCSRVTRHRPHTRRGTGELLGRCLPQPSRRVILHYFANGAGNRAVWQQRSDPELAGGHATPSLRASLVERDRDGVEAWAAAWSRGKERTGTRGGH
ncbi:unnamed protein product [Sphacelaria rigidula]